MSISRAISYLIFTIFTVYILNWITVFTLFNININKTIDDFEKAYNLKVIKYNEPNLFKNKIVVSDIISLKYNKKINVNDLIIQNSIKSPYTFTSNKMMFIFQDSSFKIVKSSVLKTEIQIENIKVNDIYIKNLNVLDESCNIPFFKHVNIKFNGETTVFYDEYNMKNNNRQISGYIHIKNPNKDVLWLLKNLNASTTKNQQHLAKMMNSIEKAKQNNTSINAKIKIVDKFKAKVDAYFDENKNLYLDYHEKSYIPSKACKTCKLVFNQNSFKDISIKDGTINYNINGKTYSISVKDKIAKLFKDVLPMLN